jgi:hypothetical protein
MTRVTANNLLHLKKKTHINDYMAIHVTFISIKSNARNHIFIPQLY